MFDCWRCSRDRTELSLPFHWPQKLLADSVFFFGIFESLFSPDSNIDLSRLVSLNELNFSNSHNNETEKWEKIAKNLVHLERLCLGISSIDQFLPFIRHSKRLRELCIDHFSFRLGDNRVLDLCFFDEERRKLAGACPISITIDEYIYLPTKWCTKNLRLNHVEFVRCKRPTSQ